MRFFFRSLQHTYLYSNPTQFPGFARFIVFIIQAVHNQPTRDCSRNSFHSKRQLQDFRILLASAWNNHFCSPVLSLLYFAFLYQPVLQRVGSFSLGKFLLRAYKFQPFTPRRFWEQCSSIVGRAHSCSHYFIIIQHFMSENDDTAAAAPIILDFFLCWGEAFGI